MTLTGCHGRSRDDAANDTGFLLHAASAEAEERSRPTHWKNETPDLSLGVWTAWCLKRRWFVQVEPPTTPQLKLQRFAVTMATFVNGQRWATATWAALYARHVDLQLRSNLPAGAGSFPTSTIPASAGWGDHGLVATKYHTRGVFDAWKKIKKDAAFNAAYGLADNNDLFKAFSMIPLIIFHFAC